jgi:hypothetical protein
MAFGSLLAVVAIAAGIVVVATQPADQSNVAPERTGKTVTIFNMVTSGPTALREGMKQLRLFNNPAICYQPNKCATTRPQFRAGDKVEGVVCQVNGARVTNGADDNRIDDHNPGLYTSPRWYGVRTDKGLRYFSEVWAVSKDRGGLGLSKCQPR